MKPTFGPRDKTVSESQGYFHAENASKQPVGGTGSRADEPFVKPSVDYEATAFGQTAERSPPSSRLTADDGVQRESSAWSRVQLPEMPSVEDAEQISSLRRYAFDRRMDLELRRVRKLLTTASGDFVVLYSADGPIPPGEQVAEMVAALDRPVDRGDGSRGKGHNVPLAVDKPDLCITDDGSNVLISRAWQRYVREGAHAVTLGFPAATPDQPARVSTVVIRRSAVRMQRPPSEPRAWRKASWWISMVVLAGFFAHQAARVTGAPTTRSEGRWLEAARAGSVNDIPGDPLPGSSLWPAIARPILEATGTGGVRALSLLFTIIAIASASSAASRLFGRWSGRCTTIVLSVAMLVTGVATSATPTPLAMGAIGVSLLGIALVEHSDRRSYILLAGLAATIAVVASYPALVFVFVLTWFFTLLRGRDGLTDSNTFRLVLGAGVLAWFLPTREASVHYMVQPRWRVDWTDLLTDTLVLFTIIVAISLLATVRAAGTNLRRRVLVLTSALLAVPFAHLLSGASLQQGTDISIALIIVTPAVGGAIAHRLARLRYGFDPEPAPRSEPELLTVDPTTGRTRRRLVRYANRQVRLAAFAVVVTSVWYLPWAVLNVDWRNWWLAIPFLFANFCIVGTALLSAFNNWNRAIPISIDVAKGHEPLVGVIVPTYAEPLYMVLNTVRSVFDQDWPADRLRVVVSDDAHDDVMRDAIAAFAERLPSGSLLYNRPPKKGDPERRGESKSGNLNSAVQLLDDCEYIETRDSDDLVGSSNFLRATVSQLMDDPGLGYMQTIKETTTSEGDPFNNNEPFFYRGTMLARNADYAIFPCGSGLVWRRAALKEIDDFPVWNLVEDLHSGVLGLRAGWRGLYVPLVGAYAQHSPEDIANVFKQRGTWALDTTRLLVFDRFRGIPWRMRLHFLEQAIFYLLSIPLLLLVSVPAAGLFLDRFPLDTDATTYAVHFWGFALAIELMLLSLAASQPAGSLWRSRLSWIGMAPIYAKAAFKALRYGPNRKPAYKVTRKTDDYQWYVRMVKVHWVLMIGTVAGTVAALSRDNVLTEVDLGSLYWGLVAIVGMGSFLRLSWFGVDPREKLVARRDRMRSRFSKIWTRLTGRVAAEPVRVKRTAAPTPAFTDINIDADIDSILNDADFEAWAVNHPAEIHAANEWIADELAARSVAIEETHQFV